jgi:hypothetical protein
MEVQPVAFGVSDAIAHRQIPISLRPRNPADLIDEYVCTRQVVWVLIHVNTLRSMLAFEAQRHDVGVVAVGQRTSRGLHAIEDVAREIVHHASAAGILVHIAVVIPISDIVNECGLSCSFSHRTSLANEVIPGITLCLFYVSSQGQMTVLSDCILQSHVCRGWKSSRCFNNARSYSSGRPYTSLSDSARSMPRIRRAKGGHLSSL